MLLSDRDESLALKITSTIPGAYIAGLSSTCTPSDPLCVWTYSNGVWQTGADKFPLNVVGDQGITHGAYIGQTPRSTVQARWTIPSVLIDQLPEVSPGLTMRAWNSDITTRPYGEGDAADYGPVSADTCYPNEPSCTWTITRGLFKNGRDQSLSLNARGGASNPDVELRVTSQCADTNPDCTWTLSREGVKVDGGVPTQLIRYYALDPWFLRVDGHCLEPGDVSLPLDEDLIRVERQTADCTELLQQDGRTGSGVKLGRHVVERVTDLHEARRLVTDAPKHSLRLYPQCINDFVEWLRWIAIGVGR